MLCRNRAGNSNGLFFCSSKEISDGKPAFVDWLTRAHTQKSTRALYSSTRPPPRVIPSQTHKKLSFFLLVKLRHMFQLVIIRLGHIFRFFRGKNRFHSGKEKGENMKWNLPAPVLVVAVEASMSSSWPSSSDPAPSGPIPPSSSSRCRMGRACFLRDMLIICHSGISKLGKSLEVKNKPELDGRNTKADGCGWRMLQMDLSIHICTRTNWICVKCSIQSQSHERKVGTFCSFFPLRTSKFSQLYSIILFSPIGRSLALNTNQTVPNR